MHHALGCRTDKVYTTEVRTSEAGYQTPIMLKADGTTAVPLGCWGLCCCAPVEKMLAHKQREGEVSNRAVQSSIASAKHN